jgi:hypothetical protein
VADIPGVGGDSFDASGGSRMVGPVNGGMDINLPEIEGAARSVSLLNTELKGLEKTLRSFGTSSGSNLNNLLKEIKKNADSANMALAGGGGGGSGTGSGAGSIGGSSGTWFSQATSQIATGSRLGGGLAAASQYVVGESTLPGALVMGSMRYLRDRIGTTRNLSIASGAGFGMAARQQGTRIQDIMEQVSRLPGGIQGDPSDLLSLFSQAPMYGASYNFGGNAGGQGVRAAGLLSGLREAQAMTPGATVQSMLQTVGGYAANSAAQRESVMMTGGAYSIIGAGGRQKSISEWSESILKWLTDLRGGSMRGKPFTYGELMAQYFPGSNIDAWFQANGVPQNMRDYWWTYALGKANKGGDTGGGRMEITPDPSNVASRRLAASTELTRTEFSLGSSMTSHYLKKEDANRDFNRLFGALQTTIIPQIADKLGGLIDRLPDTIEDILFSLIENISSKGVSSGPESSGGTIWGAGRSGDVGDSGGYGEMGGTGLAGLSPNMKSKLGPMMRANPRLRVNSGLRDTAMQKRLRAKGHSRVSGKPSAHTRGDAADLGPASEYGWLVKNASKFGLKSGASQGEPWHVGVGDFDLGSLMGMLGGGSDVVGLLGQLMSGLFGTSGFGAGGADKFDLTSFASLFLGGAGSDLPGMSGGYTVGGGSASPGGAGASGSYDSFFRQVLTGMNAAVTPTNLAKLGAVAKYEGGGGAFNPFNYVKGPGTNFNSVGVKSYPDWGTGVAQTIKLLQQKNTSNMRSNLMSNGSYSNWVSATSDFYQSWGGHRLPNISEGAATAFLSKTVPGDVEEMSYRAMGGATQQAGSMMQFNNTFMIGNGGGGNGGIDVRRTVTLVADRLEDEMNKRMARTN